MSSDTEPGIFSTDLTGVISPKGNKTATIELTQKELVALQVAISDSYFAKPEHSTERHELLIELDRKVSKGINKLWLEGRNS